MIQQRKYYFEVTYCGSWNWGISSKKGEINLIFNKRKINISYSFDGVSENNFYLSWIEKINNLKEKSESFDFTTTIELWCNRLIKNYSFDRKELENSFLGLTQESLKVVREILKGYTQQYDIILNNCGDYSSFINAVDFLEDLPYRLNEVLSNLLVNQEEISITCGKVNENYTMLEGKIESSVEKVGNQTNFFYFWRCFYGFEHI